MDIEQISADGIPLNIADTQARADITEIKSNLTELQITDITNSYSMGANAHENKVVSLTSLGVSSVNDILAITILVEQPTWVTCGLYYGTLTATSVSIGLHNSYNGTLTIGVTLRVWHR